jgi:hypothetical protein
MSHYKQKRVVIEAHQWSGSNWHLMLDFAGRENVSTDGTHLFLDTEVGREIVSKEGWVIRSPLGGFFSLSNEVFEENYEEVDEEG